MKQRNKTKLVKSSKSEATSKSHLSEGFFQESPGQLKKSQNQTNGQNLLEVSNPTHQVTIEEIAVSIIQPFHLIPDYNKNTESVLPIVAVSSISVHCIDGWELIEKGVTEGYVKIRCLVYHLQHSSNVEIAIQKVAIRTMPQGGTCSYSELVRNAGILFKMLMASAENPVMFSHGGARKGASYTENKENNIRILLTNRLGRSVSTINKYLNHSEFLNSEVMQALIRAEVGKGFFEAAQPYKRKVIISLKSDQKSEDEISAAISESILSLLREFQVNGKTAITYSKPGPYESPLDEKQIQNDTASGSVSKQKEFKHWSGNSSGVLENTPTVDDVCQEIKTFGSDLIKFIENKDLTVHQMVEIFSVQIIRLARLIQQLKHLDNANSGKMEGQDNG